MTGVREGSVTRFEVELVRGMRDGSQSAQYRLYEYCLNYFQTNYRGVFFASEDMADEIFQNTFIKLWENIEHGRICVEEGMLRMRDGTPLRGSLLTYFMGIARLKHLEVSRTGRDVRLCADDMAGVADVVPDDTDLLDVVEDLVAQMPERCREILTKFYFEGKTLDRILEEIPSMESKNALKTRKHKCMDTLRETAKNIMKK